MMHFQKSIKFENRAILLSSSDGSKKVVLKLRQAEIKVLLEKKCDFSVLTILTKFLQFIRYRKGRPINL